MAYRYWIAAYGTLVIIVVGALFGFRWWALDVYGTQFAKTNWEHWRTSASKQTSGVGPVMRRKPKSDEPPAYVLMSRHFQSCLTISLVLSSALFGTFLIIVRGTWNERNAVGSAHSHRN